MARYIGTADLERPQAEVFDYLADFSTVAEWDPSVTSALRIGRGPLAVGSRFRVQLGFLGRPLDLEYRIVEIESPHHLVLEANTASFRSLDTITVSPRGASRSRVVYDARIELKGIRSLFDPALQALFSISGERAVRGLRRALGSRGRGTGRRPAAAA